ncbi:hypothetical protein [Lentilactobacillus parafarraginis]|uniref:Uncharacterized protein n=1 Tax=Lentilactobacillus parafarraginis DSM 18390 = JCM 14109 TaxID=1423786 RepID=A0A0R1YPT2_9LACO|nr:hypothetical protein [Lentilactobacillus parafarraginis]KRM44343.1 hypothetical protein FD47_GL000605 [Lentilactobacillus parafarraginis DSM 18390 = JCM 14109]
MTQTTDNQQISYDLTLINNWQKQLNYSDDQVRAVIQIGSDDLPDFLAGHLDVDTYDLAAERMRKVAFKQLLPHLDTRSAYLLNGMKFEIRDLRLTPETVRQITGVSADEYKRFLAGQSDRLVYEDAFDWLGVYYYFQTKR